jgi:hypothetical protein
MMLGITIRSSITGRIVLFMALIQGLFQQPAGPLKEHNRDSCREIPCSPADDHRASPASGEYLVSQLKIDRQCQGLLLTARFFSPAGQLPGRAFSSASNGYQQGLLR